MAYDAGFNPIVFAFFRFAFASICFFVISLFSKKDRFFIPKKKDWPLVIAYAIISGLIAQLSYALIVNFITASQATSFSALGPIASMIIALCLKEEKLTILRFLAVIVSVGGGCLLVGLDTVISDLVKANSINVNELIGFGIALINVIGNAFGRVVQRNTARRLSIVTCNLYLSVISTIVMIFVVIPFWHDFHPLELPWIAWFALAFAVLAGSVGCFMLMSYTSLFVSPVFLSIYLLLIPFFTVIISAIFLGEVVSWRIFVGLALCAIGIILIAVQQVIEEKKKSKQKQVELQKLKVDGDESEHKTSEIEQSAALLGILTESEMEGRQRYSSGSKQVEMVEISENGAQENLNETGKKEEGSSNIIHVDWMEEERGTVQAVMVVGKKGRGKGSEEKGKGEGEGAEVEEEEEGEEVKVVEGEMASASQLPHTAEVLNEEDLENEDASEGDTSELNLLLPRERKTRSTISLGGKTKRTSSIPFISSTISTSSSSSSRKSLTRLGSKQANLSSSSLRSKHKAMIKVTTMPLHTSKSTTAGMWHWDNNQPVSSTPSLHAPQDGSKGTFHPSMSASQLDKSEKKQYSSFFSSFASNFASSSTTSSNPQSSSQMKQNSSFLKRIMVSRHNASPLSKANKSSKDEKESIKGNQSEH
eukprot:MONOS_2631.1-p1 / transcript=MONOS_2631.1 / gene=MONOS_2631 / organism=Monocercomonoides_exilis_PA203 / gene_product=unspecified product / transcript_product=unspecified product / location=Mono_scaffold00055:109211-111791(-) / protein_length=647 / sequence_SO=supercontig / SO=protein_coding / is_pseudo=false